MNQTLLKLYQLQQQRTRWLYLAKRQLNTSQLLSTLSKYLALDSQLAIQQQQLIQSLNLIRQLKEFEQTIFKRWTIKVLVALDVPHFVLGKMEVAVNILDLYAELWRFWGEFGLAMKMEWLKIRIKTHQVSVYRMLAEKLIQHMRKKLMTKMKSYRIFVRTVKNSMEEVPIVMTGSKIMKENTVTPEKSSGKSGRESGMIKSVLLGKSKFTTTHSDNLIKSTNFQKPRQTPPIVQKPKQSCQRSITSQGIFIRKRLSTHSKKQVLRSIYQPIDIKLDESYPLKLNREEILKSLMLRNGMGVGQGQGPVFKREARGHERLYTIGDCVTKGEGKREGRRRINEDLFIHNRISL